MKKELLSLTRKFTCSILCVAFGLALTGQTKDSGVSRKILANGKLILRNDTSKALDLFVEAAVLALKEGAKEVAAESYFYIAEVSKAQDSIVRAIRSYEESGRLYEESSRFSEAAAVYTGLGKYESDFSRFTAAMQSFRKSDEIAVTSHLDLVHANNLVAMGMIFSKQGELVNAQHNFVDALEIFETHHDSSGIADSWNGIGVVHWKEGKNDAAVEAYKKSLAIRSAIGDSLGMATSYSNLGVICRIQGKFDEGLTYYTIALGIRERMNDLRGISQVLFNIGSLLTDMNRNAEGLDYYNRSYAIKVLLGDHYGRLPFYLNTGEVFGAMGRTIEQEAVFLKGLALADSLHANDYIKAFSYELSAFYAKCKDFEKAYEYHSRYSDIKDTLLSRDKNAELSRLQTGYDLSEKQRSIDQLIREQEKLKEQEERDKLFRNLLIVIIIIILLFLWYIVNRTIFLRRINSELETNKKLVEKREKEKEVLLREIHHRVKNNLQLTSSMLNLQAREVKDVEAVQALKDARDRIKAISIVHQELFAGDEIGVVRMEKYISDLCGSILASNPSSKKIAIQYDIVPVNIPIDESVTVGLVINEAVTNAIKHAFAEQEAGTIIVSCTKLGSTILIVIQDNGKGLDEEIVSGNKSGFGMKLLKSLGTKLGAQTTISNNNGTRVSVELIAKM